LIATVCRKAGEYNNTHTGLVLTIATSCLVIPVLSWFRTSSDMKCRMYRNMDRPGSGIVLSACEENNNISDTEGR
jgi:hypothetical protein